MYTLEYMDDTVGFMVHRWDDAEYRRALLVAQHVDRSKSTKDVIFKKDGDYAEIWPTYVVSDDEIPF